MRDRTECQAELGYCSRRLLLILPNQPKVEMRLGQARLQPQGLFERRDCAIQIAFPGKPHSLSVINFAGAVPAGACAASAGSLQESGCCAAALAPANSRTALQQMSARFMMDPPRA